MIDSFFSTLECEVLDRNHFTRPQEARTAIFSWLEVWYNTRRRHSSLGYLSPWNLSGETTALTRVLRLAGVRLPHPRQILLQPAGLRCRLAGQPFSTCKLFLRRWIGSGSLQPGGADDETVLWQ